MKLNLFHSSDFEMKFYEEVLNNHKTQIKINQLIWAMTKIEELSEKPDMPANPIINGIAKEALK